MLDDVTKSKEQLVEKYEGELKRKSASADEAQRKLLEDHRLVVDAANQRHSQEMSTERLQAETKFTRMKQVGEDCYKTTQDNALEMFLVDKDMNFCS